MYYDIPQQTNTNSWQPNSAIVQDQSHQQSRQRAQQVASQRLPGWRTVDIDDDGDQYRVHVRDGNGHFRTVTMDGNMNVTQEEDGYC